MSTRFAPRFYVYACMLRCAQSLCHVTLCDPMDCSLLGFSVNGIFQARILEWAAISYARGIFLTHGSNLCLRVSCIGRRILYHGATLGVRMLLLLLLLLSRFSRVRLCNPIDGSPPGSPAPGISRQEHWSGLPFPSPMHESEK